MDYIQLNCRLPGNGAPLGEILIARLAEIGFESFEEIPEGIAAYIPARDFSFELLDQHSVKQDFQDVQFTIVKIAGQNWNAVWESNFNPVTISGKCHIRAPFHPPAPAGMIDLVIEPKMSFGTAHHETTALIIEQLLHMELAGKSLLDMGSGTAILAILASKIGANPITAIDNDEWAFHNALENVERNKTDNISVYYGDASQLGDQPYEIILANINRNILMADMAAYVNCLIAGGILIMSGFYLSDLDAISRQAEKLGLIADGYAEKNNWVAACFHMPLCPEDSKK
ncbi:MAG: 50S ribosomal protein L11 methyltransferase [Lentimicrobium sp.]|jgi:ribosomal protein L11 methyltransferase|nr:50S ribosomal protein L11 methyltransferase [Lentimicrobium sp.]